MPEQTLKEQILEELINELFDCNGCYDRDCMCDERCCHLLESDARELLLKALDRDRERIYKRISEEYTGSCGYYDDIDIKNACYDK